MGHSTGLLDGSVRGCSGDVAPIAVPANTVVGASVCAGADRVAGERLRAAHRVQADGGEKSAQHHLTNAARWCSIRTLRRRLPAGPLLVSVPRLAEQAGAS